MYSPINIAVKTGLTINLSLPSAAPGKSQIVITRSAYINRNARRAGGVGRQHAAHERFETLGHVDRVIDMGSRHTGSPNSSIRGGKCCEIVKRIKLLATFETGKFIDKFEYMRTSCPNTSFGFDMCCPKRCRR